MVSPQITVAVPAHPARVRNGMLDRALASVYKQTLLPATVSVAVDLERRGAARTRQRALDAVKTPWTAFLDSDDWLWPEHLAKLSAFAEDTGADYVYSWFETDPPAQDPFPTTHFTEPWDAANPRQTTITVLVRTELAKAVGFVPQGQDSTGADGMRAGEDWIWTLGCNAQGRIEHLPERTWTWSHHGLNSSGLPGRGDA